MAVSRTYIDVPETTIQTQLGPVTLYFVSNSTINIRSLQNEPLMVNGVEYTMSIRFDKQEGGIWLPDRGNLYLSRVGSLVDASKAARDKVYSVLMVLVTVEVTKLETLQLLALAEVIRVSNKLFYKNRDIEAKEAELIALDSERKTLLIEESIALQQYLPLQAREA